MPILLSILMLLGGALTGQAAIQSRPVEYKHGDTVLEGHLAYDDAIAGKRPGILIVHQWMGLGDYEKSRARQLAEMGYVAFALDMYGKRVRPTDAREASKPVTALKSDRPLMRALASAGLAFLKMQPHVDTTKIAAVGYGFGGTGVLELARGSAEISGVVCFHGGLDTPIPAVPGDILCRVLVLHGADDPFVPPAEVLAFEDEMRRCGADWQLVAYGRAVHSFSMPGAGNDNSTGAAYNEKADRRSWEMMKQFFAEVLE
ncbi:MAG: dienelactone hydrolase family protein [Acidobacteria bacterium]|nr:dienelactone hydrolase family protein [Acidobacteriota bacterium]